MAIFKLSIPPLQQLADDIYDAYKEFEEHCYVDGSEADRETCVLSIKRLIGLRVNRSMPVITLNASIYGDTSVLILHRMSTHYRYMFLNI